MCLTGTINPLSGSEGSLWERLEGWTASLDISTGEVFVLGSQGGGAVAPELPAGGVTAAPRTPEGEISDALFSDGGVVTRLIPDLGTSSLFTLDDRTGALVASDGSTDARAAPGGSTGARGAPMDGMGWKALGVPLRILPAGNGTEYGAVRRSCRC